MFELFFMVIGLILIYYTILNFKRTDKLLPVSISLYTIFVFLLQIFNWSIPEWVIAIISIVMIIFSLLAFFLGVVALTMSETNEEKTKEVIKRQKLGQRFGAILLFASIITIIKAISVLALIIN